MARPGLRVATTSARSLVGATFQDGARLGSGFTVPKMRAMASVGRKLA
jgi:hypothetical protein